MRVVQVGERVWVVLDELATRVFFVIEYAPAVHRERHETHMLYRVDHWVLQRHKRWPLGFFEELRQAVAACERELTKPGFAAPVVAPDGTVVPPDVQQSRWQAGLDPRTGQSRPSTTAGAADHP